MMVPTPASTKVNATFIILETYFTANWESDITFSGCILAKYRSNITQQNVTGSIWLYPSYVIFKDKPHFECWENEDEEG